MSIEDDRNKNRAAFEDNFGNDMGVPEKTSATPLWTRAFERFLDELEENNDYLEILEDGSLESLLHHAESIKQAISGERTSLASLNRLGPILKFVDDFSAVVALSVGADAKLTAVVWGSIRLILTLASSGRDSLNDVVEMLEELSLTLPRFRDYERSLPVDKSFEVALLDVYTEAICFYARTIHFFRNHPHGYIRHDAWTELRGDFNRTIRRMKRLSAVVESEADIARMRVETEKYGEVLDLIRDLKETKIEETPSKTYYVLPQEFSNRFWAREDAFKAISDALEPGKESTKSLRTFALFGMGGVGKTKIALRYAYGSRQKYEAIFWIAADNAISMGQSFREVAEVLGLMSNDDEKQDAAAATMKVKTWLNDSRLAYYFFLSIDISKESRWLLVFDNADDINVLKHAWPGSSQGSILITSRDSQVSNSLATEGIQVKPFDHNLGAEAILQIVGLDKQSPMNMEKAKAISHVLGGLPLAITQIGNFIAQRKLPLQDFLPLYERNAAKIDARKTGLSGSEHTLSTVWELSLGKLSGPSSHLQNILALLEPDAIDEVILVEGSKELIAEDFEFLQDDLDLGDAEEALLQAALIEKNIETGILSIHRLVQSAVMRRLSNGERTQYFDVVVELLSWGFPDHWKQDQGHQFKAWTKCEKCLPHVNNLVKQSTKYGITCGNSQLYGELLLKCSWYLYERESYDIARGLVDAALATFPDQASLAYASAVDLSGLIDLDMSNPTKALGPFKQALRIRESQLPPDDPFIAFSLNNIALAHTEIPNLEAAYDAHQKAIDIRLRHNSDRIGNSYSNFSSLLLRMGKPNEAEEILKRCPALKDFTDDTFLKTGNPRFSGDMVLLARIRRAQGRAEEGLRLATKALAFRRNLLGNRFKTCDSLYDVASMLHQLGKSASAIDILNELVTIASALPLGEGQLARGCFKLSTTYADLERAQQSEECKASAIAARAAFRPEAENNPFDESEFAKLCPWMLW